MKKKKKSCVEEFIVLYADESWVLSSPVRKTLFFQLQKSNPNKIVTIYRKRRTGNEYKVVELRNVHIPVR